MWHIYTWLKLLEKFKTETSLWSMSRTLEDQICRLWIRSPKISYTSCTYLLTLHLYFRKLAGFLRLLNPWWQNKVSCWGQVFRWSQRSSNSGVDGLTSEERSVDVRSAARFPPAPLNIVGHRTEAIAGGGQRRSTEILVTTSADDWSLNQGDGVRPLSR